MSYGIQQGEGAQTPMRCPLCGAELVDVKVRDIGDVTARLIWQLHAGRCPEHGWFQAEVISTPPREIFPVSRPGGTVRPVTIAGQTLYAFPTVWNRVDRRQQVNPFEPRYWQVDWERIGIPAPAPTAAGAEP